MYLKKLERFQKQIEARGEFSLKKKLQLKVVGIGSLELFKFLPEGIHQPSQQRQGAVEYLSFTLFWWERESRIKKLLRNLSGGALGSKQKKRVKSIT